MRGELPIRVSLILLLLLVLRPVATAGAIIDKITIKDGSILKGEIKRVDDDELILDTDYADDVVIDVEHIVDIMSKQLFSVRLISGEIISGFLAVSNGKIVLREDLPAPGDSKAAEAPGKNDLAEPAREILLTTAAHSVEPSTQQTPPIA